MASGNSAIYHTVTGPLMGMECVKNIPGSYYVIPYLANVVACPGYRPGGKQAIRSIDTIPVDLPIVIIHSKKDPQLPFDGACALYHRLRTNGNDNVYLIRKEGMQNIQVLGSHNDKEVVKRILRKHLASDSLSTSKQDDLKQFQPDPSQFKKQYDELIAKEAKHVYLERTAILGGLGFVLKKTLEYYTSW